jgi:eukaryotic-like serine/threonine-protein kinase
MAAPASTALACVLGRYALGEEIARGGLATVHLGLLLGESGFSRTIALKRLLPGFARDQEFIDAFLDEAKLAARIRHPNVVPTLDVLAQEGELFVVMEYVHGESLAGLIRAAAERGETIPLPVVSAIFADALAGLHAVHEVKDERGAPLNVIHRDVSPQNVLVGVDGVARVLDFGIAKAAGRAQITRDGQVKGKLGYLSPEQLRQNAGRGSDIYAAGVCLWEALTMQRLFSGDNESAVLARIMAGIAPPPSKHVPELPPELDAVVVRALRRQPGQRFATAREMARALEAAVPSALPSEVGAWVEHLVGPTLAGRADHIAALETEGAAMRDQPAASGTRPITTPSMADDSLPDAPASAPQIAPQIAPVLAPVSPEPAPRAALEAPRRRAWLVWAGLVAAFVAAFVAGFAWSVRPSSRGSAAADVAPPAGAPAPTAREVTVAPPAIVAPPSASAAPEAIPAATTSPDLTAVARPSAAPIAAPKSACDPPYSVDASGIRHYKKGCLR